MHSGGGGYCGNGGNGYGGYCGGGGYGINANGGDITNVNGYVGGAGGGGGYYSSPIAIWAGASGGAAMVFWR